MGDMIVIVLLVIASCTAMAVLGTYIGTRLEQSKLGGGTVETEMRSGLTPNVLGGLFGIIPFLVFVIILAVIVITNPRHPAEGTGGASTSAHE